MHPEPSGLPARPRPRWLAVATYHTEGGPLEVPHDLDELSDLHDLIERGPNWDSVIGIKIERLDPIYPGITVEQAEAL